MECKLELVVEMPKVPVVQAQVQQQAIPGIRMQDNLPIESFGGGEIISGPMQAGRELVQTAGKIFQEEQKKADDAATSDYYTKLASHKQGLFWDPKDGAFTKKGRDALAAPDEYGKKFDAFADELEKTLSPSQLAMAKKIRQKERMDFDSQLTRHVAKEAEDYTESASKAGIITARNDAVLNYQEPGYVAQKIKLQEAAYMQTASGKAPEVVQQDIQNIRSNTHAAVINRMLENNQDGLAKNYFEKNKADLTSDDLGKLEKSINTGTLRGESQRMSDKIIVSTDSMSSALEATRKIENPELRDETVRRVKDFYSTKKLAEEERNERLHKQAGQIIDETGDIDSIPPALWNDLSVSDRSSLRSYSDKRKKGEEPSTDWESYYSLKTMAASPDLRQEFMRTNLMTYRDKLSDSEFKDLVNLQDGLRQKSGQTIKELDGYRSNHEIVNTALSAMGLEPNPKPRDKDAARVSLFKRKVDEAVVQHQQRTGKPITNTEMQAIVDDLSVEGVVKRGWIFDDRARKFELEPGQELEFRVKDIPSREKAKIEQALRSRNLPVTEDRIIALYTRKVRGSDGSRQ